MFTKVVSVISILVFLIIAAVVALQVLEYKFYDGTMPQSASVWPPQKP